MMKGLTAAHKHDFYRHYHYSIYSKRTGRVGYLSSVKTDETIDAQYRSS